MAPLIAVVPRRAPTVPGTIGARAVGMEAQSQPPRLVVIGGGFGGLHVARGLRFAPIDIVLVDHQNHHLFQPLLYQVASAVLSPADIAQPIRRIFRDQPNVRVVLGEAERVDRKARCVEVNGLPLPYDYLVLAAGATHSYFGHEDWAPIAPGLKSIDDAVEIRRRILLAFESAELESDAEARRAELSFVVVGGGPTGVELAGALKEIAVQTLRADFRCVDTGTARVVLVEGQDRLLPGMSEASSRRAARDLERMGVELRLGQLVTDVNPDGVRIGEQHLPARNVFWAAGVRATPLGRTLGVELDRVGRVLVGPDCSVPGDPNVFVIGDMAHWRDPRTGQPAPGLAQTAMQMGDYVAELLRGECEGDEQPRKRPFRYRDKGTLATIGRARAVADLGGRSWGGFVAWLLWSIVHVMFLIGFKNKLSVMLSWAWSYALGQKGARLITKNPSLDVKKPKLFGTREDEVAG